METAYSTSNLFSRGDRPLRFFMVLAMILLLTPVLTRAQDTRDQASLDQSWTIIGQDELASPRPPFEANHDRDEALMVDDGDWVVMTRQLGEVLADLNTLAQLSQFPNAKLAIGSNNVISIQKSGWATQSFPRLLGWGANSVTNEHSFKIPLVNLFREAMLFQRQGKISRELLIKSFEGLTSLLPTYEGNETKRLMVEETLFRISLETPGFYPRLPLQKQGGPPSLLRFLERHGKHLLCPFSQGDHLKAGEEGFCLAVSLEWLRRIGRAPGPAQGPLDPAFAHLPANMKSIKRLQQQIDQLLFRSQNSRFHVPINEALAACTDPDFQQMEVRERGRDYVFIEKETTGREVFAQLAKLVALKSFGGDAFHAVILAFRGVYNEKTRENPEGHAMGFAVDKINHHILLFDPNVGIFSFPSMEEFLVMAEELFEGLYKGSFRGVSILDPYW